MGVDVAAEATALQLNARMKTIVCNVHLTAFIQFVVKVLKLLSKHTKTINDIW